MNEPHTQEIAIVGLSGRFPGAGDVEALWRNLCDGVESIAVFSDQELADAGIDPALLNTPQYIKARAVLEDVELFDAPFFGYTPREAEIMDPQHRLFLEGAVEALGNAGYDPEIFEGPIGVYAGVSMSSYLLFNLVSNPDLLALIGVQQVQIGNEKDHLPTRVSYKLNLTGPSVNVNTTCSTSLVAVHLACQSLLSGECDMALAGGITILLPQKAGYLYREGGTYSPDGHCRAFDARAQGMVDGNGLGIVVLKRMADARVDGDYIHAVIKGSAINNDGGLKAGYTAPSVQGQAKAIAEAQAMALVEPETISYVEAHGTGTTLGDPIEIAALTQVFRAGTEKMGFCAIGSVKTNVGHLGAAAGVTGLLKTVMALKHRQIPPSLHFERPNPAIDFANSPFYVNTTLSEWKAGATPRRAGVSSFGIGGTNAHAVLEEAPPIADSGPSRPWQLLVLSSKTGTALETATDELAEYLKQHPAVNLADVAYTLQVGRTAFRHRRMLVCRDRDDALNALETRDRERLFTHAQEAKNVLIAFMFPGQGAQYVQMAAELYQVEPAFRKQVDRCSDLLKSHLGLDLRDVLYPDLRIEDRRWKIEDTGSSILNPRSSILDLDQTWLAQPALFVVEYALARLWMEWGMRPQALIGHSIGEYVAACLAGVLSIEDALALVAIRGRMTQMLPTGAMLSLPLPAADVSSLLGDKLSLAASNGPSLCVVSGPSDAVDVLHRQLAEQGVDSRRLHMSHAFHSAMMDPILEPFAKRVKQVTLKPPKIPYVSNLTGTWITAAEATDPGYWARHLRQTVRFAEGIQVLLQEPNRILLEVGPGRMLSTFARQHADKRIVLTSLRHPQDQQSDSAVLLTTLGKLWLAEARIDWRRFSAHERRHRLPLPTYPFERQRYWIEPKGQASKIGNLQPELGETQAVVVSNSDSSSALHPRPDLLNGYTAPTNELEQRIADIWQGLLGIEQVGIHDNFFELGGHSLMATQLVSRLREAFPVEVPLRSLFETPTIAKLAEVVAEMLIEEIAGLSEEEVRLLL